MTTLEQRSHFFRIVRVCAALAGLVGSIGGAHAQDRVDFSGTWYFGSLTPLERPEAFADQSHFTPEQAARFASGYEKSFRDELQREDGDEFVGTDLWLDFGTDVEPDLRTSLIIVPENGRLPARTDEAQRREDAATERRGTYSDPEVLDVSERCIVDLVPVFAGPDSNYMSIVQNEHSLLMVREFISTRVVRFVRGETLAPDIRLWQGVSTGIWEGDELIVKTTNFRPDSSLLGAGPNAVLTERLALSNGDQIRYEFTIDDPATFAQPWTARTYWHRTEKRRYEFACHEGNYFTMRGILLGSRIQERAR